MASFNVEVEAFPYFDKDGIKVATFFGEEDDPIEDYISWKDMIDRELEGYLIRGVAFAANSEFCDVEQFREFARQMREAADYFDQRINDSYLFDRAAWHADGAVSERFMDFCTKISELDDSKNQLKFDF